MSTPLPSTVNSPAVYRRIMRASAKCFPRFKRDVFYEHGQWFMTVTVPKWMARERRKEQWRETYSVVDARGWHSYDGFGFELLYTDEEE